MPITKSAKKAIRGSLRKKAFNDARKKAMKDVMKKFVKLAKSDQGKAQALLAQAYQAIDKAAKRGVIKRNNAARKKARLARLLK